MGSPFEGSYHIKPPDREGPGNGDCLEGGGWHMALVCKKLATDASLDQVLSVCPGRRPIKACTESFAYKGPSCSVIVRPSIQSCTNHTHKCVRSRSRTHGKISQHNSR